MFDGLTLPGLHLHKSARTFKGLQGSACCHRPASHPQDMKPQDLLPGLVGWENCCHGRRCRHAEARASANVSVEPKGLALEEIEAGACRKNHQRTMRNGIYPLVSLW